MLLFIPAVPVSRARLLVFLFIGDIGSYTATAGVSFKKTFLR